MKRKHLSSLMALSVSIMFSAVSVSANTVPVSGTTQQTQTQGQAPVQGQAPTQGQTPTQGQSTPTGTQVGSQGPTQQQIETTLLFNTVQGAQWVEKVSQGLTGRVTFCVEQFAGKVNTAAQQVASEAQVAAQAEGLNLQAYSPTSAEELQAQQEETQLEQNMASLRGIDLERAYLNYVIDRSDKALDALSRDRDKVSAAVQGHIDTMVSLIQSTRDQAKQLLSGS